MFKLAKLIGMAAIVHLLWPVHSYAANGFQEGTWIDTIPSVLTMYLDAEDDGTIDETLVFDQIMAIKRYPPFTRPDGLRQVNIKVLHWQSTAFSNYLQSTVEMRSSNSPQPHSQIVSNQPGADFPATLTFNVVFDLYIDGDTVLTQLEGTAVGSEMYAIPSIGEDTLTVQKSIVVPGIGSLPAGMCASMTYLSSYQIPDESIPTLSEWGMIIFCVLLFAWMAWMVVRRRRAPEVGI